MRSCISDRLIFLYGDEVARDVLPRLARLMNQYAETIRTTPPPRAGELTERDIMLITYPDQVREANALPLETLEKFLSQHVSNLISDVHLLPFYPSSSDDGFSVEDYRTVDPAFGD